MAKDKFNLFKNKDDNIMRFFIRVCLTVFITFIYCCVWMMLEKIIDGCIVDSLVDNIIMLLFIPIIFISTDVFVK